MDSKAPKQSWKESTHPGIEGRTVNHCVIKLVKVERVDHVETGAHVRALREKLGLGLREVARALQLSAAYVSDLELGKRSWTRSRAAAYVHILGEIKEGRWTGSGITVTEPASQPPELLDPEQREDSL